MKAMIVAIPATARTPTLSSVAAAPWNCCGELVEEGPTGKPVEETGLGTPDTPKVNAAETLAAAGGISDDAAYEGAAPVASRDVDSAAAEADAPPTAEMVRVVRFVNVEVSVNVAVDEVSSAPADVSEEEVSSAAAEVLMDE